MWIFLNDSFLSIVAHRTRRSLITVRARKREDIEVVFPDARIVEGGGTDYEFRAVVRRRDVARAMAREVERIGYTNFKDSVREQDRHDTYLRVWSTMMTLGRPTVTSLWPAQDWTDKYRQDDSPEPADRP